jgi:hypothetical protein
MAAHVGLIELIGNGYANHLLDSRLRAEEFSLLGRLANALPPRRLIPHAEPMLLPKLCHAVLADLRFAACSSTECLSQGL